MKRLRAGALLLALVSTVSLSAAQDAPPEEPPSAPSAAPAPSTPEPPPSDAAPAPSNPPPSGEPPAPSQPTPVPAPSALAPFPSASAAPPPTATFAPVPPPAKAPPPKPAAAPAAAAAAPAVKPDEPPPVQPKDDDTSKKDDQNGLLGPFRIGPVIGVGLPSLINVGGVMKLTKYFAAGINIGISPNVKFSYYGDATVQYNAYQVYGHIHPFGGGFYLGASVGYAHAHATAEQVVPIPAAVAAVYPSLGNSVTLKSDGTVQTMVLTPELGYFYTFKSGFSLGVGAGLQLPIASSEVKFEQDVNKDVPEEVLKAYLDPTARSVKDTLERVGQTTLPTVGICIGWLL